MISSSTHKFEDLNVNAIIFVPDSWIDLISRVNFSLFFGFLLVSMKFLLEFVTCCRSSDRRPAEETRLLVVQQTRRGGGRRKVRSRGGGGEWRPSLSSISEEAALMAEKISSNVERPVDVWRRMLKRKVSSMSQRDRNRSSGRDYDRRAPVPNIMPAYSAAPFMF